MSTGFETLSVEELDRHLEAVARWLVGVHPGFSNGDRDAAAVNEARRRLREPMQPGWTCSACGAFVGEAKERHSACRCCGLARQT